MPVLDLEAVRADVIVEFADLSDHSKAGKLGLLLRLTQGRGLGIFTLLNRASRDLKAHFLPRRVEVSKHQQVPVADHIQRTLSTSVLVTMTAESKHRGSNEVGGQKEERNVR